MITLKNISTSKTQTFNGFISYDENSFLFLDKRDFPCRITSSISNMKVEIFKNRTVFQLTEDNGEILQLSLPNSEKISIDKLIQKGIELKIFTNISYSDEKSSNDKDDVSFNTWYLSLEKGRQKVLQEDKWMLADAAFKAGQNIAIFHTNQSSDMIMPFFLHDFENKNDDKNGQISVSHEGISICINGYKNSDNNHEIIFLEHHNGELNLRLYEDKSNCEPTKTLDFSKAKDN